MAAYEPTAEREEEEEEETARLGSPPVLHVMVVGFHHQKGATVEFSFPPLCGGSESDPGTPRSITSLLPPEWRHLPHIALPDGCHNYERDSVFFTLPLPSTPSQVVYGVACCRQIDTKELEEEHQRSEEVTRSTVQKSVCVLSRVPLFGFIEAKLDLITHAYFNSRDFSNVAILHDAYKHLNSSLATCRVQSMIPVGLSPQAEVLRYEHRLLQVFKALLLQQRVLLYGSPSKDLCNSVLTIASLFPTSLQSLGTRDKVPPTPSPPPPLVQPSEEEDDIFPLAVFSTPTSLQPYVSLQQFETVRDPGSGCLLFGTVNPLFEKQHKKLCKVFVSLEDGVLVTDDLELRTQLGLTTADLRFSSFLTDTIQERLKGSKSEPATPVAGPAPLGHAHWLGSDDWVWAQFKLYLLSLLATSSGNDATAMEDFNSDFMAAWLNGPVYSRWREKRGERSLSGIEPKHVCAGDLSVSDLKRRLLAQASDYGLITPRSREQVSHAVQETQRVLAETAGRVTGAVGSAWTAASSAMYSWWYSGGGDEDR